jgi:4-aminobutyrate aminotransferase-like enzyme
MLVNSGSEANDIAWRIATAVTGRPGALVTEHAYHGVTAAIADLSPEEWPDGYRAPNVARIPPRWSDADLDRALADVELGVTFLDGALTSDGIDVPSPDRVAELVRRTHAAGGLYVADEVQAGHGRTGEHLWSFAAAGITPDFVTLGKPMGNGYPVAAVITRSELAERFPYARRTFSTFGGNPVAAAAALAVLDVIEDERLVEQTKRVGAYLRERLPGDARGTGLLLGVQLESAERAKQVVDRLREDGILIGRTGKNDDVLKIRPPLVFTEEHADLLAEKVSDTVAGVRHHSGF